MSDLGLSAARAYVQTANALASQRANQAEAAAAPGFGDILNSAVSSVAKSGAAAETAVTNAAMGRGDIVDVVTAVAAAEATLETVIAVRNEVIRAYQDIMRMPI
jgi:flagellar hook-basal body complex protein FliE